MGWCLARQKGRLSGMDQPSALEKLWAALHWKHSKKDWRVTWADHEGPHSSDRFGLPSFQYRATEGDFVFETLFRCCVEDELKERLGNGQLVGSCHGPDIRWQKRTRVAAVAMEGAHGAVVKIK